MATDPTPIDLNTPFTGVDNLPGITAESGNALDAAFAAKGGNPDAPEAPLAEKPVVKADDAPPAPAPKPKKEKPPIDEPFTEISSGDALDALANPPKEKAKPAPKADDAPPADAPPAPVKDEFDEVELPVNVKPNTVKSFDRVKEVARERIAAVLKEKDALAKEIETLKTTVKTETPKEIEAELKTLREFRAKLDVEADPAFNTYDKTVADNTESIYAKLIATPGITDEQIKAIKDLGGPGEVDWDAPGVKLPAPVRRFIDAKLLENETVADKKVRAIADAKANAMEYLSTRKEESSKGTELANQTTEKEIDALLPKFPWFGELKAKDGATDEDKKAIESHNALIAEARGVMKDAVTDNSPQMRSILAVGYAQLLKTRADFEAHKVSTKAKEAAHVAEKATLTKELDDVKAKLEKIKRASTTRLRDTSAEDPNTPSAKKAAVDINTPGSAALDAHLAAARASQE
jgi:hypothetical protein